MSDYIGQLLCLGKATEADIEELFSYRLGDNLSLIERQGSFKSAGRIDLLYKNRLGKYVLYELKKGVAKLAALEQIKRYMRSAKKKYKISASDIAGVVLAHSIDPELALALSKEPSIKAKKYFFGIDLK